MQKLIKKQKKNVMREGNLIIQMRCDGYCWTVISDSERGKKITDWKFCNGNILENLLFALSTWNCESSWEWERVLKKCWLQKLYFSTHFLFHVHRYFDRYKDFLHFFHRSVSFCRPLLFNFCWFRWNFLHTFVNSNIDGTNLAQWKNVKRRRLTTAGKNTDEHLLLALLSRHQKYDDTGESFPSTAHNFLSTWREWQKCLFKCLPWNFFAELFPKAFEVFICGLLRNEFVLTFRTRSWGRSWGCRYVCLQINRSEF